MGRRGHQVTICHGPPGQKWPSVKQPRRFVKRARRAVDAWPNGYSHHLERSTVNITQYSGRGFQASDIPDADVTFSSWWSVWREAWALPASKGIKIQYVRHHELHGGPEDQVHAAYKLPGPKVVIANWLADVMHDYGHPTDQVLRVPNGVVWDQFDSQPREKADVPTVGMLMRGDGFKDTKTGMKALKLVQDQIPNVRIIGFGQDRPDTHDVMPDGIEFHLQPEQDQIPKLYQSCDCWVLSSISEGFGMPGIEAAAGHCPIVSTRSGGPEDYVNDGGNGFLVDVGDAQAMADRIVQILKASPEQWRSMSAQSYQIAQEFDWDRSAEKLEQALYRWIDSSKLKEDELRVG